MKWDKKSGNEVDGSTIHIYRVKNEDGTVYFGKTSRTIDFCNIGINRSETYYYRFYVLVKQWIRFRILHLDYWLMVKKLNFINILF